MILQKLKRGGLILTSLDLVNTILREFYLLFIGYSEGKDELCGIVPKNTKDINRYKKH